MPPSAWVDEACPDTGYVLTASLVPQGAEELVRFTMGAVRPRNGSKLHWHDEREPGRKAALATVAALDQVRHLSVVHLGSPPERVERRRRRCLERMLFELHQEGVGDVVLEARSPGQNKLDRDMLDALRTRRVVSGSLRMAHALGHTEPLLWVPDMVCGAVAARARGDCHYVDLIGSSLIIIEI